MKIATSNGTDDQVNVKKSFTAIPANGVIGLRFYFKAAAGSFKPSTTFRFAIWNTGGTATINTQMYTDASGNPASIDNFNNASSTQITPNRKALTGYVVGAWNVIEVDLNSSSTTGGGSVYCNGALLGSTSNLNNSTMAGIDSVSFGDMAFGSLASGASIYFDDVRLQNTSLPVGAVSLSGTPTTVWSTSQATNPWFPSFNGSPGTSESSVSAISAANEWYWDGSSTLYVYGPGNPSSTLEIPTRDDAISANGISYITLNNLDIRGGVLSGFYCGVTASCNNVTFDSSTIELNYQNGVYFQGNSGVFHNNGVIKSSIVRYNGASGVAVSDYWQNWLIQNNQVYNNCLVYTATEPPSSTAADQHVYGAGINLFSSTGNDGTGSIVKYNMVHDNGLAGQPNTFANGIHGDTVNGVTYYYNTIYNNPGEGLFMEKNKNSVAIGNVIYNSGTVQFSSGLELDAADIYSGTGNLIANNTVYGGFWTLALIHSGAGGITLSNNKVENNVAVGGSDQTLYVPAAAANDGTHSSGNTFSHNSFGAPVSGWLYYAGAISTYAALDTAVGTATNSVSGAPLFTNAAGGDFSFPKTSPLHNAGMIIPGIGQQVSELIPDLGAYEYVPGKLGTLSTSQLGNRYKAVTR